MSSQLEDFLSEEDVLAVDVEEKKAPPPEPELPPVPPPNPGLAFPELNKIQEEALRAFYHSKTKHGAVVAPVGVGKTVLGMRIWDALGRPNVLIVVPRIVLIQNPWKEELVKLGIEPEQIGEFYSEVHLMRYPITITLYQTLLRHPYLMERFDMVIFDEADILGGPSFYGLLEKSSAVPYALGLTGTMMEAYSRSAPLWHHLPRIIERTISDAHGIGLLAPAEVIHVPVTLNTEERRRYNELTAAYHNLTRRARKAKPYEANILKRRAFIVNQARFGLLSTAEAKEPVVLSILKADYEAPTLVFSSSVENAAYLRAETKRLAIPCELITAETPSEERERIVSTFGKDFQVLFSVGVLARGYNVPKVSREILVGTTSNSVAAVEQRLGRALRRDPQNPEKRAKVFVVGALNTIDADMLRAARFALARVR